MRVGQGAFALRAGAVIARAGKVLLARNDSSPYGYTVGGAVELGETAEQALCREVREELGTDPVEPRLVAVQENFWRVKEELLVEVARGALVHELVFFFQVDLSDDFEADPGHVDPDAGLDASPALRERFEWVPIERLPEMTVFPTFLADLVGADPDRGVRHIVTWE